MPRCKKCQSNTFAEETLCKEHYYELHTLTPEFHKYKEKQWRDYLTYYLMKEWNIQAVSNRQLPNTTVIPDLYFVVLGGDILCVVEVDEYQHKLGLNYSEEREEARYTQISSGYKKVFVFRINPDSYQDRYNTKEKSSLRPALFRKKIQVLSPGEIVEQVETNHEEFEHRKKIVTQCINGVLLGILKEEESSYSRTYDSKTYYFFSVYFFLFLRSVYLWFFPEEVELKIYNLFFDKKEREKRS
jgi:hypothetical protein